jgi:hypothetical protein
MESPDDGGRHGQRIRCPTLRLYAAGNRRFCGEHRVLQAFTDALDGDDELLIRMDDWCGSDGTPNGVVDEIIGLLSVSDATTAKPPKCSSGVAGRSSTLHSGSEN